MLKILRPRGIRSLKFVPSSGPGAFFPGVFLTGALPPGRYEGHWSPDRVRGVLVPGKLWGHSFPFKMGRHFFPINLLGHSWSGQLLGAFIPQKSSGYSLFIPCMILFSGYQGFYSFMVLFFLVTKLVTYSCMMLFFWFSLKKTGNFAINTKHSNIFFRSTMFFIKMGIGEAFVLNQLVGAFVPDQNLGSFIPQKSHLLGASVPLHQNIPWNGNV